MIQSTRAVGIVIKDSQVLLMRRVNLGNEYYTFPGGGVEKDETIEETVIRELAEETTLKVKIERLLYVHEYSQSQQYYYLCKYTSGVPQLADNSEEKAELMQDNLFEPMWIDIDQMTSLLLYPLEIRDWLIEDFKLNFTNTYPRKAFLDEAELRQSL